MQLTLKKHGPWEGIKDDGGPKVYRTHKWERAPALAPPIAQIEQRHKATVAPYCHEALGRWASPSHV
jgi:hypothetical protein